MACHAGGTPDERDSPEECEWLLEDMIKLLDPGKSGLWNAFGLVPKGEVISIFLGGLPNYGTQPPPAEFQIAKTLLHTPYHKISPSSTATKDVYSSCSRESHDNATDSNYKVDDMGIAYNRLSVPKPSNRIVKEQEFIKVMSRSGIPIPH
ncbi:hypothetical protein BDM02DRAFT_3192243 [Thelephora ganbajun]|uniref:Uncharacterized protein n=1 Tax=Thelephora ganbajun TaxID=370292 RepID=A0ACB6Z0P6_THEGA|nr:hypothetical protein BDM02DRAFT_3192243 [Thelephora ganbajun]